MLKKEVLLICLVALFVLVSGCGELDNGQVSDKSQASEESPEIVPQEAFQGQTKWYVAGEQITGLSGKDGAYTLVIGDITASSGMGEYEITLSIYKDDLVVDMESLGAGSSTNFGLLDNTIHVIEVKKFEVGAEPFKVSISIE